MSSKEAKTAGQGEVAGGPPVRGRVLVLPILTMAGLALVVVAALAGIGLGLGAAIWSVAEKPKPPPVVAIAPRLVVLPELVGRRTIDGQKRGVLVVAGLELQTTGAALILQSKMPRFIELAVSRLEERLDAYRKSKNAIALVSEDLRDLADRILTGTSCADLAVATQAEGCVKGSELPTSNVIVFKMIEF